jgi:hypothetical protein
MRTPYCKTGAKTNPVPASFLPFSISLPQKNRPIDPANSVMISWLMLQTIVSDIPEGDYLLHVQDPS